MFFPGKANDPVTKDRFVRMRKLKLLELRRIQGDDVSDQITEIEEDLFSEIEPKRFDVGRLQINHITSFNETCVLMQQYVPKDPKTMTVIEYFQTLDIIRDQLKKRAKANKRK